MRKQASIFVGLVLATALLQGCNQQTDNAAKVQADIAKAEADGQKQIIDAQAKLDQVVAQNNKTLVGVRADAQKDAADKPAEAADADIVKARSEAEIKVADAQYEVDKAKAAAARQVAEARCEALALDAKNDCMSRAKTDYASATATAKAKNDAVHAAH